MTERSYRVLIFAMAFPPAAVGTATYAHRLARGFAEKGSEVLVLAPEAGGGGCAAFDRQQPYRTARIPFDGFVPLRYLAVPQWLCRTLREFRPDSLWTTNGVATRVAGLVGELDGKGLPVVSCMRGTDIVSRLPGKGLWARLESIPQRRCYNNSTAVAAASEYLKQVAVSKGIDGDKIFINPSGFDFGQLEGYQYDPDRLLKKHPFLAGRKVVLTVARLTAQKRVDLMVRAVAQLATRVPDLCYVVVGDGPQRLRLRRLVAELGVGDRVFLVGAVPPMSAELYDFYSRAQVFAMTSVGEGMANVFMEAGAFELPSLGVADGSMAEIVRDGETGLLAGVDDVDDIAAKLEQLLLDVEWAGSMGRQARQWIAARFNTEAMAERSYRVLQAVVEGTWPDNRAAGAT